MVAGVRFEGRAMVISKFVRDGNAIALVRDRNNQFSPNAIEVRIETGHMIGFMPEIDACVLAPLLDQGAKYKAWVKKVLVYGRVPVPVVVAQLYGADYPLPDHPFDVSRKALAEQVGPGEIDPPINNIASDLWQARGSYALPSFLLVAVVTLVIALATYF